MNGYSCHLETMNNDIMDLCCANMVRYGKSKRLISNKMSCFFQNSQCAQRLNKEHTVLDFSINYITLIYLIPLVVPGMLQASLLKHLIPSLVG